MITPQVFDFMKVETDAARSGLIKKWMLTAIMQTINVASGLRGVEHHV